MALKDIFKKKDKPNVSVWFLFITSAVILIFFLWYFLIYVNGNEKLLIQKSFRVLTQIGENFKARENSFRGITESRGMKDKLSGQDRSLRDKWLSVYWRSFEEAKKHIKFYSNIEIDTVSLNKDYFYISKDSNFISGSLTVGKSVDTENKLPIYFKINKKDFFEPIERKDVFDEIIIIKDNTKSDPDSIYEFIYSSVPGDVDVKNLDSLIVTDEGLSSGIVKDIELLGIEYVLFMKQIQLLNNEWYYVGGVINKENYVRQTRSINAYVALLLLIIFFIILFSIPLVKLKIISENLQFKISHLSLSILSILFGAFFTLLIILSIFSHYQREENANDSLRELSDTLRNAFISEIMQMEATLNKFRNVARSQNYGTGTVIPIVETPNDYNPMEFEAQRFLRLEDLPYKYFRLIFALDKSGQQKAIATSRLSKPAFTDLSYRTYFKESGEWELDSLQIMLDFIVSNSSGEKLGVVSKRNKGFIYVITSRLYSVINTILPAGYGFCVIDKKGEVKFHSNSERMLQENFIGESEYSSELKQAIYGNLKIHFSANYAGKKNLCYVQPIKSLPLHLVTFYDQSYLHSVNLKIANLTFIFSLLVLAMFFLIVIGSRVVNYNRTELNRNLDLFDWLKPNKRKIEKSRNIYIANIIAIALIIAACIISNPENVIFIVFLFIITQIVTSYYYMNFISWDHFRKNYLMGLIPPAIIISLLLYFAFNNLPRSCIYQIFVFNFLLIAANLIVIRFSTNLFFGFKDHTHLYIYFYSWIALIVITPVFIFFITFYNHEVKSDIVHNLYTYAKKEAKRNYEIDKFYDDNVKELFHDYKNSLKNKGVYYLKGLSSSDVTEFNTLKEHSIDETLGQILFELKFDLDQQSDERKSLVKELPGFSRYSTDVVPIKYPDSVLIREPNSVLIKFQDSVLIKFLDSVLIKYPDSVVIEYPPSVFTKHPEPVLIKYPDSAFIKFQDSVLIKHPEPVLKIYPDSVLMINLDSVLIKYPNSVLLIQPDSVLIKNPDSVLIKYPNSVHIIYPNLVLIKYPYQVFIYKSNSVRKKYPASVFIKYTAEQIHSSNTESTNAAYYRGELDTFGFGKPERWILFLAIILFFCYILFKLLKFVSDKISTSSIGLSLVKVRFRDKIYEHINSNNNLMVQFSSAAEMKAYDNKKNEEKYFSKFSHTTIEYNELHPHYFNSFNKSNDRILIQDIHIDFNTPQSDCKKLSIINNMAENDKIQLILILDCSFARIIDDNEQSIELEEDEERLKLLKSMKKILVSMNNKFVHLFPPLKEKESIDEDEEVIEGISNIEQLKTVIKDELSVSDYLQWKYERSTENYASRREKAGFTIPHEKIILKIEEYAMVYYESIWEACSNSEKILLYDISDDMLLNDKNKKVIKILLFKGLLKNNGYIDIMNKSFRNFIVTKFESEYKAEYIKKYESSGKWRSYRAPILLIVLALAFFIALQENLLSSITSILPVIIGALGLITKVSGIFSKSNALQSSTEQSS